MGDRGGRHAAQGLDHADAGARHLVIPRRPAQLQDGFHRLVHARGAQGMAAGFQAAKSGQRELPLQPDHFRFGQRPALALRGEPGRFQRKGGMQRGGIVQLKEIHLPGQNAGAPTGAFHRQPGCVPHQRGRPVVNGQGVRHQAGPRDPHRRAAVLFRVQVLARQQHRRSAVGIGRHVKQVQRLLLLGSLPLVGACPHGAPVHGIRVGCAIGMGHLRKAAKGRPFRLILRQVAVKKQAGQAEGRQSLGGLKIGIQHLCQEGLGLRPDHIRHLFHAQGQGRVHHPRPHRQDGHAQGSPARGIGRLDSHAFHARQPGTLRQQSPQVGLARGGNCQHIANVDHLRVQAASVLLRGQDRLRRQLAQAGLPVLSHRGLPHTRHHHFCLCAVHVHLIAILPRKRT